MIDHVNATRSSEPHDAHPNLLIDNLQANCTKHGIAFYGLGDPRQGIEHVVVPEQGLVSPGMLIACGDSHTTTYGAYGALGLWHRHIRSGTCARHPNLRYKRMKTMRVTVDGETAPGVTAKDIIMKVVQVVGAGGANGFAVEFAGSAIHSLDMAGRMTVCNMAVELGARAALIAADEVTETALKGHSHSGQFAYKAESWISDPKAIFDEEFTISGADIEPLITWGTSPDQSVPITANVPCAEDYISPKAKALLSRSLQYMGLIEGQSAQSIKIDTAFIGSCTNSRIEDLREAAKILEGRHVAKGVEAIVVPGSAMTRIKAEAEGLRAIFEAAGFEWRPEAGCSMCLAMNDDIAMDGERVASSTNRNFEGRQGRGARTHLMSPAMVAAAAISGHLADVRDFK